MIKPHLGSIQTVSQLHTKATWCRTGAVRLSIASNDINQQISTLTHDKNDDNDKHFSNYDANEFVDNTLATDDYLLLVVMVL